MSEGLNLHLVQGENAEIILRKGEAAPIHVAGKLELAGNFKAPVEFVQKRYKDNFLDGYLPINCHVIFNKKDLTITLVVGEQDRDKATVQGKLKKFDLLGKLKINNGHFTPSELLNLIKHEGHRFNSRDKHRELVHLLRNLDVKTTSQVNVNDDRMGSKGASVHEQAETKLAGWEVSLNLPLFEGYETAPITFTLEVEPNNGSVLIYPVSETFSEFYEKAVDDLFEQVRPTFEPFVIIETALS